MKVEDLIKFLLSWKYRFCGVYKDSVVFATERSQVAFYLRSIEVIIRDKKTEERKTYPYGCLVADKSKLYTLDRSEDGWAYSKNEADVAARGETFEA